MDISNNSKKVGLALGGGGAKGLAHIGVIKTLIDADISIDFIVGTSMGALVGGWYAATQDINFLENLFLDLKRRDVFKIKDLLRKKDGVLFKDNSVVNLLQSGLKDLKIENCAIPFKAIATDIKTGEEIVIEKGSISEAIKASTALPIVFNPVEFNNKLLMDGGFVNPVPADVARKMGADIIIAVDVSSKWINISDKSMNLKNIYSMLDNALGIIEYQISRNILKEADIIIKPLVLNFDWLAFDRAREIIDAGSKEIKVNLKEIRKLTGHKEPSKTIGEKFLDFLLGKEN